MADSVALKMDSKSQFLRSVEILSQLSEVTPPDCFGASLRHSRPFPTSHSQEERGSSRPLPFIPLPCPRSQEERDSLSLKLEETSYADGTHLWKAGDPADCLVLVKSGQIEVRSRADSDYF